MNRFKDLVRFIDHDSVKNYIVEPPERKNIIKEKILELLTLYNPGIIIKTGIGNHELMSEIASAVKSHLIVIEPSMNNIKRFLTAYGDRGGAKEIKFINGYFESFPIDYYSADLVISVDYFDCIYSGKVIDEFSQTINFERKLFLAGTVLDSGDIDGVLDDLMKEIFPLHNDYYLPNDLETFLDLNEFRLIKGEEMRYRMNIQDMTSYFAEIFGSQVRDPGGFIGENSDALKRLYGLDNNVISMPYHMGTYSRKKPEAE